MAGVLVSLPSLEQILETISSLWYQRVGPQTTFMPGEGSPAETISLDRVYAYLGQSCRSFTWGDLALGLEQGSMWQNKGTQVSQNEKGRDYARWTWKMDLLLSHLSDRNIYQVQIKRGFTVSKDLRLPGQERDDSVQRLEHVGKVPHVMEVQEAENMLDLRPGHKF